MSYTRKEWKDGDIITAEGLNNLEAGVSENKKKLEEKSGVEPGTYGGYDSSVPAYNIPKVTVDEYGRVTEVSNSVLAPASAENNGYLSSEDYARLLKTPYLRQNLDGITLYAGNTLSQSAYYIVGTADVSDVPVVNAYGVHENNGRAEVIPLTCSLWGAYSSKTLSYTWYVDISIPEALEYDLDCFLWSNYQPYRSAM